MAATRNFRITCGQGTRKWSHTAKASSEGAQVQARPAGSRVGNYNPRKSFGKLTSLSVAEVHQVLARCQLPQPSLAPLRPQVQCRSLKPMVHTRQVKHTAKQAHNTHVWECHAFGPRMSHKEAIRQEITLDRVEVDKPGLLCSSGEEAVFWFTPTRSRSLRNTVVSLSTSRRIAAPHPHRQLLIAGYVHSLARW